MQPSGNAVSVTLLFSMVPATTGAPRRNVVQNTNTVKNVNGNALRHVISPTDRKRSRFRYITPDVMGEVEA